MLLTKEVEIGLNSRTMVYYENLGYKLPKIINNKECLILPHGSKIKVRTNDLTNSSDALVEIECDGCRKIIHNKFRIYKKSVKEDNTYYCKSCSNNMFGKMKILEQKLLKSTSFYDWCYENLDKKEADEIIFRWDIKKNGCTPKEISYGSTGVNRKGYWFKCLAHNEHESELKKISGFTSGKKGSLDCFACNSFAMCLITLCGKNAIDEYWSDKNTMSPWIVSRGSAKNIYIKCQSNHLHIDYKTTPALFSKGRRCPKCNFSKGEFEVEMYFKNKKIDYEQQYIFSNCKNKQSLQYDFYLKQYNIVIEYQGIHHFKPVDFAGKGEMWAENQFKENQIKDNIKRKYCIDNKINLLEIWYYDFDNIETILDKELNLNKNITTENTLTIAI